MEVEVEVEACPGVVVLSHEDTTGASACWEPGWLCRKLRQHVEELENEKTCCYIVLGCFFFFFFFFLNVLRTTLSLGMLSMKIKSLQLTELQPAIRRRVFFI